MTYPRELYTRPELETKYNCIPYMPQLVVNKQLYCLFPNRINRDKKKKKKLTFSVYNVSKHVVILVQHNHFSGNAHKLKMSNRRDLFFSCKGICLCCCLFELPQALLGHSSDIIFVLITKLPVM